MWFVVTLFITSLYPGFATAVENSDDRLPTWLELAGPPDPVERAIQRRKYELHHEISILAGGLPVDPFTKGITGTVGYTLHFSDYVAWELVGFTYSLNRDTDLKTQFFQSATLTEKSALTAVNFFVASHLVAKPFYGKEAVMDYSLAHIELFLYAGPALVQSTQTFSAQLSAKGFGFGVDGGFGLRLWLGKVVSLRAALGELVYFYKGKVYQGLNYNCGFAFNLGADD